MEKLEPQAITRYFQVSEKVKFLNPALMSKMRLELDEDKIQKLMWVGQLVNPYLDDYDITEDLAAIAVPVLIFHGDYDTIPLESFNNNVGFKYGGKNNEENPGFNAAWFIRDFGCRSPAVRGCFDS